MLLDFSISCYVSITPSYGYLVLFVCELGLVVLTGVYYEPLFHEAQYCLQGGNFRLLICTSRALISLICNYYGGALVKRWLYGVTGRQQLHRILGVSGRYDSHVSCMHL